MFNKNIKIGNYSDMPAYWNCKLVDYIGIGDYQGDWLYIVEKNVQSIMCIMRKQIDKTEDGSFGYVEFSYGSCSGCDVLEGCDNEKERQGVAEGLYKQIQPWKI